MRFIDEEGLRLLWNDLKVRLNTKLDKMEAAADSAKLNGKTADDYAAATHVGSRGVMQHALGNGTTAGFSSNDFTTAEKMRLAEVLPTIQILYNPSRDNIRLIFTAGKFLPGDRIVLMRYSQSKSSNMVQRTSYNRKYDFTYTRYKKWKKNNKPGLRYKGFRVPGRIPSTWNQSVKINWQFNELTAHPQKSGYCYTLDFNTKNLFNKGIISKRKKRELIKFVVMRSGAFGNCENTLIIPRKSNDAFVR